MTGGLLLAWTALAAGQQPPPINGVTGTIALEGTVQKTYSGVNTLVVKTVDGVEHLFHLTDKTAVHGGKSADDDALRGIRHFFSKKSDTGSSNMANRNPNISGSSTSLASMIR